ncbi:hypothetical protein ACPCYY_22630, partial [Bacillus pumilus]|uniref:hypothetical protein n=1 Tax=Bacillus pumilus TaxID=1408 RepID=UPI003C2179E6
PIVHIYVEPKLLHPFDIHIPLDVYLLRHSSCHHINLLPHLLLPLPFNRLNETLYTIQNHQSTREKHQQGKF